MARSSTRSTTTTSMPLVDEKVDDMRPDEARAARDEHPHVGIRAVDADGAEIRERSLVRRYQAGAPSAGPSIARS